jgi:hypothetical protein
MVLEHLSASISRVMMMMLSAAAAAASKPLLVRIRIPSGAVKMWADVDPDFAMFYHARYVGR